MAHGPNAQRTPTARPRRAGRTRPGRDDLAWWRDARFGLFIHWGLYALPAGVWRGRRVANAGELLMLSENIPVATYAKLAARFHPRHWNAETVVRLAKAAGMGYVVVTAKHHDGFAMYRSAASPYNVVDATPWRHDPLADLADACRRHGLRLGIYYSQDLDWHHPDGAWNDWDFAKAGKRPARYLREKVLPQLTELLTRYGPVGLVWFDMPVTFTRAQGAAIRAHVKRLRPHCLVCGRLGHGLGDYRVLRDNFLPPARVQGEWEACATLNHTWGFKRHDHAWKSAATLITTLVDLTSKGANYLLNVGPDAQGVVPVPSVTRLRAIGAWLRINGPAIHGASPGPFGYEFPWGRLTAKHRTLYFHFFRRPGARFQLNGLRSRVLAVSALAAPGRTFPFRQAHDAATGTPRLVIDFRGLRSTAPVTVVEVRLAAAPEVDPLTLPQADRFIALTAGMARVGTVAGKPALRVGGNGLTQNWRNPDDWLEWRFTVLQPGTYDVAVVTTHQHREMWSGGHTLRLACEGRTLRRVLKRDALLPGLRAQYYPQVATRFGSLSFGEAGTYTLRLAADRLRLRDKCRTLFSDGGIQLVEVRLDGRG
jgi:alpha-L-fucosidase